MAENEIPEPPDWSDARTFFLEPDLWHEPMSWMPRRAII